MSKLTKSEIKAHTAAVGLLDCGNLSNDDILFVFENYREDATHINSKAGAFFTPFGLARDLVFHIPALRGQTTKVIDLCAGIGVLGYAAMRDCLDFCPVEMTCVEINQDYVEIGKKLLPNARWICGDALDPELLSRLGRFDFVVSNPPYGAVASAHKQAYRSGAFEYMVIEAAAKIADGGTFIIPQMSAPFQYSGSAKHLWLSRCKAISFEGKTGITLDGNQGFDTTPYMDKWHGVTPVCEIVCCDFTGLPVQLQLWDQVG